MKKVLNGTVQRIFLVILLGLAQFAVFAQDSTGSSSTTITSETTTTSRTDWYMQPWAWVVGGVLVLVLLVALFRGNSSTRDREVSRTTVIKKD
jgi:hypothetical protein